ncbi:hypothetical protein AVEN_122241-1 [Araneus ventricosus]|uniref:Uncharacterized protein n=1 Tax=Araneus ventricosus TaxID=182803 RepID=A0A4Y2H5P4_ARAVE|nr:hypothetical protein AVEN_122241-1 [Araneus ventricosus]
MKFPLSSTRGNGILEMCFRSYVTASNDCLCFWTIMHFNYVNLSLTTWSFSHCCALLTPSYRHSWTLSQRLIPSSPHTLQRFQFPSPSFQLNFFQKSFLFRILLRMTLQLLSEPRTGCSSYINEAAPTDVLILHKQHSDILMPFFSQTISAFCASWRDCLAATKCGQRLFKCSYYVVTHLYTANLRVPRLESRLFLPM